MKRKPLMFDKEYFEPNKQKYKRYKDMTEIQRLYFPRSVLAEKIQSKAKVLDVGCAFGYFLKVCDDHSLETYGVDISEYALQKAKKNTKAKLYQKDINDSLDIFEDAFFDLVTLFDVIEHVYNPLNLLTEVHRVLKHEAKIIVVTPNANAILKSLQRARWVGFTDPTHLYLFTPDSLKFLVEKTGFRVTRLETSFYYIPRFLQKIFNKTGKGGEIWLVGKKYTKRRQRVALF